MDDGCYESAVLMVIIITNAMAWTGLAYHVEKPAGSRVYTGMMGSTGRFSCVYRPQNVAELTVFMSI